MTEPDHQEVPINAEKVVDLDYHRMVVRRLLIALLALALLYTLYTARTLLMPVVVALLFALFLSPLVAGLKRLHVPRPISTVLVLCLLGGPFIWLTVELAQPAQKWMQKLPEVSATVTKQLENLSDSLVSEAPAPVPQAPVEKRRFTLFGFFEDADPAMVASQPAPQAQPQEDSALVEGVKQGGAEIILSMLAAAPVIVAQCAVWLILVLFLLIFGPSLYDNFIDLLPMIRDKRRATILVGRLRQELSRYIVTVTIINTGLGAATALVFWFMGVEDAILWGVLVGLLNYAPYVGPVFAGGILVLAGITQYGIEISALLPVAIYFFINQVESQFVTPTLLGQQMKLNPLVLVLWLLFWGWLWGPVGVLIAVPLLLCLKLVAAQSDIMNYWVRLIETPS